MTAAELVDYTIALLTTSDPAGVAEIEDTYRYAVTVARAVNAGLVEPSGITAEGRQHMQDLHDDYETT